MINSNILTSHNFCDIIMAHMINNNLKKFSVCTSVSASYESSFILSVSTSINDTNNVIITFELEETNTD